MPKINLVTLTIVAVLNATALQAEDGSADWLRELTHQLAQDKKCDVMFYVRVKNPKGDGQGYVEARAKCADGREFDAVRNSQASPFTLSECGVAVCDVKPGFDDAERS